MLDTNSKSFVIHVTIKEQEEILVHFKKQAQVGALLFDKVPTKVPAKYFDYSDVFSIENIMELPKYNKINNHAIKLEKGKQLFFGPIYSLGQVELEILKTYIKTNLANGFIRPSKSSAGALILFNRKSNGSPCFCMDY